MPQVSRQTETSLSEINIVPLVDVVLVLLIIFMITAPLLTQGIKVELPRAAAEPIALRRNSGSRRRLPLSKLSARSISFTIRQTIPRCSPNRIAPRRS